MFEQGPTVALWGARRPEQLAPTDVLGWHLNEETRRAIDQILLTTAIDPIGPEFMAPPSALRGTDREVHGRALMMRGAAVRGDN